MLWKVFGYSHTALTSQEWEISKKEGQGLIPIWTKELILDDSLVNGKKTKNLNLV